MELDKYLNGLLGDHYVINEALVMGPYITSRFIQQLRDHLGNGANTLPKNRLTIIADDGWNQEELLKIESLYEKTGRHRREIVIHRAAPERGAGLVHIKLYFFTLKNRTRTYTKRILLLGSANASTQGFGEHAESFMSIDLAAVPADERDELENYLLSLRHGLSHEPCTFSMGRGTQVWLPAVRFVGAERISGFDAWLRSGRLCHKYMPDTSFGKLRLRLKKPLPPRGFEGDFEEQGFGSERETRVLLRNYVEDSIAFDEDESRQVWRKKYFIETYYGYWTSNECFRDKGDEFIVSQAERRRHMIDEITHASSADHLQWSQDFLDAITEVAKRIQERENQARGITVSELLHMRNGAIDTEHYASAARDKLRLDQALAGDKNFSSRYISGYYFPKVPQMGDDHADFAEEWCASVMSKLGRSTWPNRLVKTIGTALEDDWEEPETAQELLGWLRSNWEDLEINFTTYHRGQITE